LESDVDNLGAMMVALKPVDNQFSSLSTKFHPVDLHGRQGRICRLGDGEVVKARNPKLLGNIDLSTLALQQAANGHDISSKRQGLHFDIGRQREPDSLRSASETIFTADYIRFDFGPCRRHPTETLQAVFDTVIQIFGDSYVPDTAIAASNEQLCQIGAGVEIGESDDGIDRTTSQIAPFYHGDS
jgi:hypothetical protein